MNELNIKQKIWKLSFLCVGLGAVLLFAGKMMGGSAGFYIDRSGVHSSGEVMEKSILRDEKRLEKFDGMEIEAEYADVEIIPSDHYGVEYCVEGNRNRLTCEVQDGKFVFRVQEEITIRVVNFSFDLEMFESDDDYFVKVYIPDDALLSYAEIKTEDGKIQIGKLRADSLTIKDEYGDVELKGFQGGDFKAVLEDGNLHAQDMKAKSIDIKDEYGDVYLYLENSADEYSFDLETEYGRIRAPGYEKSSDDDSMVYQKKNGGRTIKILCEDGDIEIEEGR